ncbi:MAG: relaxase, partial [Prevotella sp.]|nr:relaxase [Prevotella sp.]
MIARARAVAHGSAYTTYATLKRDAEFVCCENMAGDMTAAVTDDDLDNIWLQFKYAGENYIAKGKAVSRNLIAMEVSPTKDESKGWTLEQWKWFAHRFIEEMDKIEFRDKNGKVSSKRMDLAHSKWIAMLHHDAKSGIPHLHFMVSRFTIDGRINDTNLIGLKATMAANSINQSLGWKQSQEISAEHKAEIKDALYDILRNMNRFDWNVFLQKIKERGYSAELKKDSNGEVVGYRIKRG